MKINIVCKPGVELLVLKIVCSFSFSLEHLQLEKDEKEEDRRRVGCSINVVLLIVAVFWLGKTGSALSGEGAGSSYVWSTSGRCFHSICFEIVFPLSN